MPASLLRLFSGARRLRLAGILATSVAFAVVPILLGVVVSSGAGATDAPPSAWVPNDAPNTPIGKGKGIYPGRVVWEHDPAAVSWDGTTGSWWEDRHIDQVKVDHMIADGIRQLTGASSEKPAWAALFVHFNQVHSQPATDYRPGEKIVVKLNMNRSWTSTDVDNDIDASPQVALSLVAQLVREAGVPEDDITVYDSTLNKAKGRGHMPDRIVEKCRKQFPGVHFMDIYGGGAREASVWSDDVITYHGVTNAGKKIPVRVLEAKYMINVALLKGHNVSGVTLTAKNHYGTINARDHNSIKSYEQPFGAYNVLVDHIGSEQLGGKTLLFMLDALHASSLADGVPEKLSIPPFNHNWPASIFLSQDPVALDSVGWDLCNHAFAKERAVEMVNSDNYLHGAALGDKPPYGFPASLGVHEHWDSPLSRRYSRNLGKTEGIDLRYRTAKTS